MRNRRATGPGHDLPTLDDLRAEFGALLKDAEARATAARAADPALAAVAALERADADYDLACSLTDDVAAGQQGRDVSAEDEAALEKASAAYHAAEDAMVATVPTTLRGIRAMLLCLSELDSIESGFIRKVLASVVKSPILAEAAGTGSHQAPPDAAEAPR